MFELQCIGNIYRKLISTIRAFTALVIGYSRGISDWRQCYPRKTINTLFSLLL